MTSQLSIFLLALAMVESHIDDDAIGKHGEVGRYQISQIYIDDVNRIIKEKGDNTTFTLQDMKNPYLAQRAILEYINYYGTKYKNDTGSNDVTWEVVARIHNGGPYGYKKDCTIGYWQKVKKAMDKIMEANQ